VKKESIITAVTAVVFLGIGFLAGYIYEAQRKSSAPQGLALAGAPPPQDEASGSATPSASSPPSATASGLPEGHPPVDAAALVKALEDGATRDPRDPEPRLRLANLFYDQKQYNKAIEWYRRALELDSRNVNARTDLGTAYSYVGRPRDALREYRKSLETDPGHAPTLYNLILVSLNGTHDLGTARDALERLEKLNPNYPGLDSLKQRLDAAQASGVPR
jgi:TPR repeat protein